MNKKRQHYIWRYYLNQWTTNNQIWCLRKNNLFKTSLFNIGQQKYFYQAYPLSESDLNYILMIINSMHPSLKNLMLNRLQIYNDISTSNETIRKNGIEEYHAKIEGNAIDILNMLYKKDLSFLKSNKKKSDFCYYIGLQYTRTNKIKTNIKNALELGKEKLFNKYDVDLTKISKVLSILIADPIGNWIFSKAKISFLENKSEYTLITGDQPVINIEANYFNLEKPPEKIKLYYPITPYLGILINGNDKDKILTKKQEIDLFNKKIENM